jgi:hypothetical protein
VLLCTSEKFLYVIILTVKSIQDFTYKLNNIVDEVRAANLFCILVTVIKGIRYRITMLVQVNPIF